MSSDATRFIKTLKITVKDIDIIDREVNDTIREIVKKGGKIIGLNAQNFGLSPMMLIVIIIYASEKEITFDKKEIS